MPIFWALIASSSKAVVLPVLLCPLNKVIWPKGAPGREVDSCNASENGIHLCSLNLTVELSSFFSLNLSKLKLDFISAETAVIKDSLFLAISFYLFRMVNLRLLLRHQTKRQTYLL